MRRMLPIRVLLQVLALLSARVSPTDCAPAEDSILSLPLYGPPPTPQFSGYLDASAGCDVVANGPSCRIHYWFAAAETNEAEDADTSRVLHATEGEPSYHANTNATSTWQGNSRPVVLWLNGGPGSPSTLGFLQELGPLLLNATGGLMNNPWSWTKLANVVVFESPIGVGYSYCSEQVAGGVCQNSDNYTASASRAALVDFFTNKFPELACNDFFIVGESYAGVYIPTLARDVLDHASDTVNLRGIAVGDPCTDMKAQQDSMDSLWYAHKYGLVPDSEFDLLWNTCRARMPNLVARGGKHVVAGRIKREVKAKFGDGSSHGALDLNDRAVREELDDAIRRHLYHPGGLFDSASAECRMAHRKFLMSTSNGLSQGWEHLYIDDYSLFGPGGVDTEDIDMASYMMREDVRDALHVSDAPTATWPHPPQGFQYKSEYAACNWGGVEDGTPSMIDVYREIAPRLDVTLVYNGDTDPCVSYEGTRTALERVGFPEIEGGYYRPWFYNHTAADPTILMEKAAMFGPDLLVVPTGSQFGGEIVNYENNLSFLTVHGSGHMVPQFRPQAALHMLGKVLAGDPFSPLLPSNRTLARMSGKDFGSVMDVWTLAAQAPPYTSLSSGVGRRDAANEDANELIGEEVGAAVV